MFVHSRVNDDAAKNMPAEENDAEVQAGGSEDPVKPAESAAANGMSDASAEKTALVNEDPSAPSSAPKPVRRKRDEPVAEDFRSKLYWKEPTGWKWKFNPRIRNPIKGKVRTLSLNFAVFDMTIIVLNVNMLSMNVDIRL